MNKLKRKRLVKKIRANKAKYIVIICAIFIVLLGVGYAALRTTLLINGNARINYTKPSSNLPTCPVGDGEITATYKLNSANGGVYNVTFTMHNGSGSPINNYNVIVKGPPGFDMSSTSFIDSYTVDNNGLMTMTPASWCSTLNSWDITLDLHFSVPEDNWTPEYILVSGCLVYGSYSGGGSENPPVGDEINSISFNTNNVYMNVNDTNTLTLVTDPAGVTITPTWTSSNTNVATVNNGVVTAISPGTTTITATVGDHFATCTITVVSATVPLTGLTISDTTKSLEVGDTYTLSYTKTPSNSTDNVTWSSSDNNVATVNNGVVTAVSPGVANINVYHNNIVATCVVTVTQTTHEITALSISPASSTLTVGEMITLTLTKTPSNGVGNITWSSSNTNVATVNNGVVTAVGSGSTTITATTGSVSATASITVEEETPPSAIEPEFTANNSWGAGMNFTLELTNTSSSNLRYIKLAIDLPSNATFVIYDSKNGLITYSGTTITLDYTKMPSWAAQNLPAGGVISISGQITFPSGNSSSYSNPNITIISVE